MRQDCLESWVWFLEATDRTRASGLTQHPLEPCLLMAHADDRLVGLAALHVDDMLMTGDPTKAFKPFCAETQNKFGLSTFMSIANEGESLGYCGVVLKGWIQFVDGGTTAEGEAQHIADDGKG